jgi:RNA polymerase sigma-70 factor (ECF subfamily)
MTDTELVARACGGETSAFDELVCRHHRMLYRTALAIVRSPADAEDVTQDAWLQVYRNIGRYRGEASVTTWLVAIVRNHAIDCRRATFRRLSREAEHTRPYTHVVSPEDAMLVNERRAYLTRRIDRLPASLRSTLRLWHTGRYSYAEIAQIAGTSVGTIKSRVWLARQRCHPDFGEQRSA